jgi:hypothetical protein
MGLGRWLKTAFGSQHSGEPISETEAERVRSALDAFCDRIPRQARDQLSYSYRIDSGLVHLTERRPSFRDPSNTGEMVIAKFKHLGDGTWTLLWADRNSKWHPYDGFESATFAHALNEVTDDPTGIFLG